MNERGYPRLEESSRMSHKSTTQTHKNKKNYGTMTNREENKSSQSEEIISQNEFIIDDENTPELKIDSALNQIKTYRWFFYIAIIPMILSFSFSDLIVDSLNFLELIPMGIECQTTKFSKDGENIWIPCSIHRICHEKSGDNIVRIRSGEAVTRKAQNDYYSLQNWVEDMEIE